MEMLKKIQYTTINPETKSILGGIDKSIIDETFPLQVSGGISIKNNHINKFISTGNKSKTYVKNKIIEWDSFKEVYYENGVLDIKYFKNILKVANDILPLPIYTTNYSDLIYMADKLYNTDLTNVSKALINIYDIYDPFKQSIRFLFMSYKVYIENVIEIFVKLRNLHVDPIDELDFNKLIETWTFVDLKNKTDTSSIILFFNFPPSSLNLDSTIPTIKWKIKTKNNKKYKNYNKIIDKFLHEIKKGKFQYIGFCPQVSIKRLMILFSFPISNLLQAIYELDEISKNSKKLKTKINNKTNNIINIIEKLNKNIIKIKTPVKLSFSKEKTNVINMDHKNTTNDKIKVLEKYIKLYLILYKKTLPEISKREVLINDVSQNLSKISCEIQDITKNLYIKIL
jgi:hypothetical protein